eukprot:TRINITY_DN11217_c0_g1_i1.p1 TRINITY_DN11217_c0_g1~~TRINITY_DN11217_c0_g1_i1.p1  ORF type:complete len:2722 (-),score=808.67 TRINITY_DN11217_c0_g1_i1:94-8259(-)
MAKAGANGGYPVAGRKPPTAFVNDSAADMAIAADRAGNKAGGNGNKPLWKCPPKAVRATVLVQACLRRREFLKAFGGGAELDEELRELAPPDPLIATSLYFCRRLRNPGFVDVGREATAVAGLISNQLKPVKMSAVKEILVYYEDSVPEGHPAVEILGEKLDKLVVEAQENLYNVCGQVHTPKEVKATIEECRVTFDVPVWLEDRVFECGFKRLAKVCKLREFELRKEFVKCSSVPEFDKMLEEVNKEYGSVETELRADVAVARTKRYQFLEQEITNKWARPFVGPLPPHSRALRRYQIELGVNNLKVRGFKEDEKTHKAALEAAFENEVKKQKTQIQILTKKLKEARARSIIEDLEEQLENQMAQVAALMERSITGLGSDNERVASRAKEMLSPEDHQKLYTKLADKAGDDLEQALAAQDPTPEAGDRIKSCSAQLVGLLNCLDPKSAFVARMEERFERECRVIREQTQAEKEALKLLDTGPPTGAEWLAMQRSMDEQEPLPEALAAEAPAIDSRATGGKPAAAPSTNLSAADMSETSDSVMKQLADISTLSLGKTESPALTEREPEEEELWAAPLGMKKLEFLVTDEGPPPRKVLGGLGDVRAPSGKVGPMEETIDPGVTALFKDFEADEPVFEKQEQTMVPVEITMENLSMDQVKLHTEQVFIAKFNRGLSDALGVERKRVRVMKFVKGGGVTCKLTLMEPTAEDGSKAVSAGQLLKDLTKQVDDSSSLLRIGELGPFLSKAKAKKAVADSDVKVSIGTLGTAFTAPPLKEATHASGTAHGAKPAGSPAPTAAAVRPPPAAAPPATAGRPPPAGGGGGAPAAFGGSIDTGGDISSQALKGLGDTWGASRMDKRLGARLADSRVDPGSADASDMLFRTTCPKAEEDDTRQKWATPYAPQSLYSFFDEERKEEASIAKMDIAKMKAVKQKFTAHATFKLTRHPISGTEKLKGYDPGVDPDQSQVESYMEGKEDPADPLRSTLSKELKGAKESKHQRAPKKKKTKKAIDAEAFDTMDSEADAAPAGDAEVEPLSPTTGEKGRKGKRSKKKGQEADPTNASAAEVTQEPDAEPAAGSESPKSVTSEDPAKADVTAAPKRKPAKKKRGDGGKGGEEDSDSEGGAHRARSPQVTKRGLPVAGKVEEATAQDKGAQEEQTAAASESAADSVPSSEQAQSAEQSEHSDATTGNESDRPARGRQAPGKAKRKKLNSKKKAELDDDMLAAMLAAQSGGDASGEPQHTVCWAGMHGGMPGTGLRGVGERQERLPNIGKGAMDELRTPAYIREAYRFNSVGVGPPYKTKDPFLEESPAWCAKQMLDQAIDACDWRRSYSSATKQRCGSLGPKESIRQIGRAVSLPHLKGAAKKEDSSSGGTVIDGKGAKKPNASPDGGEEEEKDDWGLDDMDDEASGGGKPAGDEEADADSQAPGSRQPSKGHDGGTAVADGIEVPDAPPPLPGPPPLTEKPDAGQASPDETAKAAPPAKSEGAEPEKKDEKGHKKKEGKKKKNKGEKGTAPEGGAEDAASKDKDTRTDTPQKTKAEKKAEKAAKKAEKGDGKPDAPETPQKPPKPDGETEESEATEASKAAPPESSSAAAADVAEGSLAVKGEETTEETSVTEAATADSEADKSESSKAEKKGKKGDKKKGDKKGGSTTARRGSTAHDGASPPKPPKPPADKSPDGGKDKKPPTPEAGKKKGKKHKDHDAGKASPSSASGGPPPLPDKGGAGPPALPERQGDQQEAGDMAKSAPPPPPKGAGADDSEEFAKAGPPGVPPRGPGGDAEDDAAKQAPPAPPPRQVGEEGAEGDMAKSAAPGPPSLPGRGGQEDAMDGDGSLPAKASRPGGSAVADAVDVEEQPAGMASTPKASVVSEEGGLGATEQELQQYLEQTKKLNEQVEELKRQLAAETKAKEDAEAARALAEEKAEKEHAAMVVAVQSVSGMARNLEDNWAASPRTDSLAAPETPQPLSERRDGMEYQIADEAIASVTAFVTREFMHSEADDSGAFSVLRSGPSSGRLSGVYSEGLFMAERYQASPTHGSATMVESAASVPLSEPAPEPKDDEEDVNEVVSTMMVEAAKAGDVKLQVASTVGFAVGDEIQIGELEAAIISKFGSIILQEPLRYDHPAGTTVKVISKAAPTHEGSEPDIRRPSLMVVSPEFAQAAMFVPRRSISKGDDAQPAVEVDIASSAARRDESLAGEGEEPQMFPLSPKSVVRRAEAATKWNEAEQMRTEAEAVRQRAEEEAEKARSMERQHSSAQQEAAETKAIAEAEEAEAAAAKAKAEDMAAEAASSATDAAEAETKRRQAEEAKATAEREAAEAVACRQYAEKQEREAAEAMAVAEKQARGAEEVALKAALEAQQAAAVKERAEVEAREIAWAAAARAMRTPSKRPSSRPGTGPGMSQILPRSPSQVRDKSRSPRLAAAADREAVASPGESAPAAGDEGTIAPTKPVEDTSGSQPVAQPPSAMLRPFAVQERPSFSFAPEAQPPAYKRARPGSAEEAAARHRQVTNSGATRQQVASFAQTLTSSIFRQSQRNASMSQTNLGTASRTRGLASTSTGFRGSMGGTLSSSSSAPVLHPQGVRPAPAAPMQTQLQFGASASSASPPPGFRDMRPVPGYLAARGAADSHARASSSSPVPPAQQFSGSGGVSFSASAASPLRDIQQRPASGGPRQHVPPGVAPLNLESQAFRRTAAEQTLRGSSRAGTGRSGKSSPIPAEENAFL